MGFRAISTEKVHRDKTPPYSLGAAADGRRTLYISGQVPVGLDGKVVGKGDFEAQVTHVLSSVKAVVEAAGGTMNQIVKLTMFLTSRDNFPKLYEVRRRFFVEPFPAAAAVVVAGLADPDWLVEIEAVAALD